MSITAAPTGAPMRHHSGPAWPTSGQKGGRGGGRGEEGERGTAAPSAAGEFASAALPHVLLKLVPHHVPRCDAPRIDEAMQKKAAGHFQLACACSFEGLHRGTQNEAGNNAPAQVRGEGGQGQGVNVPSQVRWKGGGHPQGRTRP